MAAVCGAAGLGYGDGTRWRQRCHRLTSRPAPAEHEIASPDRVRAGPEFSLDLLSRVADLPPGVVGDKLDVARARALLTGGDAGRVRSTTC